MLYTPTENTLITVGTQETADFTISANGKAFRALIQGIYSNPIAAIIRELSTNAYDSHVEAGCPDKPFDLGLPTAFYPEFKIRDYGVSMTHEQIMGLYSTMFESTKDGDNVAVGKFGLGSKTPFAYTDTFTVTCFQAGVKRVYTAYLKPDGVPSIALMLKENTAEPTGVEISFPVASKDTVNFTDEAAMIMLGFDVKPNDIHNVGAWNTTPEVVLLEGTRWKLIDPSATSSAPWKYWNSTLRVRMGCVSYPVRADSLPNLDPMSRAILDAPITITVPIGEVEVTVSRDAIHYDARTTENITARLGQISREIMEKFVTAISSQPTYAKAVDKFRELRDTMRMQHSPLLHALTQNLKYRGRPVGVSINPRSRYAMKHLDTTVMVLNDREVRTGRSYRTRVWNGKWDTCFTSHNEGTTLYYYQDSTTRVPYPGDRIREHAIALINDPSVEVDHVVWIKADPKSMKFKKIYCLLGRPDWSKFVNVADLPAPVVNGKKRTGGRVMCKHITDEGIEEDYMVDADEKDIVYVRVRRQDQIDHKYTNFGAYRMVELLKWAKTKGYVSQDAKLVIVPATHHKKIQKHWKRWDNVIKSAVNRELDKTSMEYRNHLNRLEFNVAEHGNLRIWTYAQALASHGELPTERTPFRKLVMSIRYLMRMHTRFGTDQEVERAYRELYGQSSNTDAAEYDGPGVSIEEGIAAAAFAAEVYPLVSALISTYSRHVESGLRKNTLEYINAMDKCR